MFSFLQGVVLMEIAEAHRKVHNELEENVSRFKFNFQFEYQQLKQLQSITIPHVDCVVRFNYQAKMCRIAQKQSNKSSIDEASGHIERAVRYFGVSWGIYPLLQVFFYSFFCCTFSGPLDLWTYTVSWAHSCHFSGLGRVKAKTKRKSANNSKGTDSWSRGGEMLQIPAKN